jgi:hypothetical protein
VSAGTYNIKADQGSTFVFSFTISTSGTPWNLTGYSARMQVRASTQATTTVLNLVSPTDITLTSAGVVTVTVNATTMAAATAGTFVYDLEVQSGSGIVTRLLQGKFIITPEVTR